MKNVLTVFILLLIAGIFAAAQVNNLWLPVWDSTLNNGRGAYVWKQLRNGFTVSGNYIDVTAPPSANYVGGPTGAIFVNNSANPHEIDIATSVVPRKGIAETVPGLWTFSQGLVIGAGSEPACAASLTGRIVLTPGGTGVADKLRVCLKDEAGVYAWHSILNPWPEPITP